MPALADDALLRAVLREADELAARAAKPCCSAYLLLALLRETGPASQLLADRGVLASDVEGHLTAQSTTEPAEVLDHVRQRSRRMAVGCGSRTVGTLHLLIALASIQQGAAYRILAASGVEPASLRAVAVALITGGPSRAQHPSADAEVAATAEAPRGGLQLPSRRDRPLGAGSTDENVARPSGARLDPRITRGRSATTARGSRTPPGAGASLTAAAEQYALDDERFPTLVALTRNLSLAAARGDIEQLVGRRNLVEQILDILGKRRANNPCLIGEPGVGKTALVEGLAYLQINSSAAVPFLDQRVLVELNMGALLSGTQLRGAFSERMGTLRRELELAEGRIIVFLDEIHTLVGAGAVGDGALDAVGELSAAMAHGRFPCIGATTTDNYRRYIEEAPAFSRRLQPVLVAEPSAEETLAILQGVAPAYGRHHGVTFAPETLDAAVRLSSRYITDRFLPDKAISLLDLAGSRCRRLDKLRVERDDVAQLVAETSKIPSDRLLASDADRLLQMEHFIAQRLVGHKRIVGRVCEVIRRNYAGFASERPIGSFVFFGPTGVGKTELVKVLADFLFQSRDALCRLDMSEFMEPHSVARMIGSPPGYVGHDQGGQLTEAVRRRPYQIVLLDEVEKAHRDVLQVLLQLLDDGRLTDGRGRTVDFSNTVVVMTSNLGSDHYDQRRGPIGFGLSTSEDGTDAWNEIAEEVLTTARRAFPVELWNRIEERLVFEPQSREQVLAVAQLLVTDSSNRLQQEKKIRFSATRGALEYLVEHGGYDPLLGARPMRTAIQRLIEGPVAQQILLGHAIAGDELRVDCIENTLVVELRQRDDAEPSSRDG